MPRKEFVQELCSAVHDRDHGAFSSTLASMPELALYQRIRCLESRVYEGPAFKEYLKRSLSTPGQQGALLRFQLRSGTSILRQHDSRFRDQASHDTEDRICPTCGEPGSIEYVHHMLLHCPAYEHNRAALRTKVARLLAAQAFLPELRDEEGVIAFLRDDFMGGAEEATSIAHAFLQAVITFKDCCVEQFGG